MIPPPAQREMSARAGSTVTEVPRSHAIYVSQPAAVAELTETAVTATTPGSHALAQPRYLFAAAFARVENQNGYGASAHAAAPYQTAKARLATPKPGATASSDDRSGRLPNAAPKPVDRTVIDTPLTIATKAREITPSACDSIDATSRIPTPALPPIPCTSPIANEPSFVRARCGWPCSVSSAWAWRCACPTPSCS